MGKPTGKNRLIVLFNIIIFIISNRNLDPIKINLIWFLMNSFFPWKNPNREKNSDFPRKRKIIKLFWQTTEKIIFCLKKIKILFWKSHDFRFFFYYFHVFILDEEILHNIELSITRNLLNYFFIRSLFALLFWQGRERKRKVVIRYLRQQ